MHSIYNGLLTNYSRPAPQQLRAQNFPSEILIDHNVGSSLLAAGQQLCRGMPSPSVLQSGNTLPRTKQSVL